MASPVIAGAQSVPASASRSVKADRAVVATPASQIHASSSHDTAKAPSASKGSKPAPARENYTLSHGAHRLDSYQNAVTPPPVATDR
ncbi:hypothetical protein [Dyella sp. C11]|uniref:hypothetical protein n=1 Tax=Dyella sp. C11 TaxID=2126991 RepID=UPI0013005441|nr:hypothetical protein [Dyella sp. C11]